MHKLSFILQSDLKAFDMSVKWKKLAQAGGFEISLKNQKDSYDELHNMKDVEPELFIKFVRIPSLKTYSCSKHSKGVRRNG